MSGPAQLLPPRIERSLAWRAVLMGRCAVIAAIWASSMHGAIAQPAANLGNAQPNTGVGLDTVVVEANRERAIVRRKVDAFVSAVAVAPSADSLKRWRTPICPLVAGLSREQGEFILGRISQIAAAAGAPVAAEQCQGNLYVIVTSKPEELLKAWDQRDANVFGSAGRGQVRRFIGASGPVRVWYNAVLEDRDGAPLSEFLGIQNGIRNNTHAEGYRLSFDEVTDLVSVIVLVDAARARGINFDQLAAYVAMTGLAELHLNAKMGDARSILQLFTNRDQAPTDGLSPWDRAYLRALYTTRQADKMQLGAIKTSIVEQVAP